MFDIEKIIIALGGPAGIGIMTAGIGFAYAQFRSGGGRAKDELIDTLKETALVERDKAARLAVEKTILVTSQQTQLTELNKRIGVLQGRLEEQSKKLDEYKELLKGRDPEMLKTLDEIRAFMRVLASDSVINRKRNSKIDVDTKEEIGKVLRKKD